MDFEQEVFAEPTIFEAAKKAFSQCAVTSVFSGEISTAGEVINVSVMG